MAAFWKKCKFNFSSNNIVEIMLWVKVVYNDATKAS